MIEQGLKGCKGNKSKISSKQSSQFLCRILVQKMYTIYRDTQWYILQIYRSNRNRYKRRAGTLLSGVIKISIGASIGVYKKQERKVKENIKECGKGYAAAALLLLFLLLLRLPLSGLFGRKVLDQKEGLFFGARETLCRRNGECTVRRGRIEGFPQLSCLLFQGEKSIRRDRLDLYS